jgi:hypothetical protein
VEATERIIGKLTTCQKCGKQLQEDLLRYDGLLAAADRAADFMQEGRL